MAATHYPLRDLQHDPKLAEALGNVVVAWAYAEHILVQTLARVTGVTRNMALAGYYRVPTFDARRKLLIALIDEWDAEGFDKTLIEGEVNKLNKLVSTRNHWIHGDWCIDRSTDTTVIFDQRAAADSAGRRKVIKAADVLNHCSAVLSHAHALALLIDTSSLR